MQQEVKVKDAFKRSLKRALVPNRTFKAYRLEKNKKRHQTVYKDQQLELYSQIFEGGFLHYGYFKDPKTDPMDISFRDVFQAQWDYAEQILEHVVDKENPVFDVGCGMGGLSRMLIDRGYQTKALTPDEVQVRYINKTIPDLHVEHCKFEDTPVENYEQHFGTVITSESFQYLKVDKTLEIMKKILKPGGRWVICDYFKNGEAFERSGHQWDAFQKKIAEAGGKITYERDITSNVLVSLKYAHMIGAKIALPVTNFLIDKFKVKNPGLFYLTEEVMESIKKSTANSLEVFSPERFATEKKYMLLVVEF